MKTPICTFDAKTAILCTKCCFGKQKQMVTKMLLITLVKLFYNIMYLFQVLLPVCQRITSKISTLPLHHTYMNVKPVFELFVSFSKIRSIAILVVIFSLSGLVVVGPYLASAQNTSSSANPMTMVVDGIQCNVNEQFLFHIHTHIDIFVNGKRIYIPHQIGIIPGKCIYWMHTHDESGVIHIESPIKRDFTVGQFFDLWKMKLSNSKVFDNIFNGKDVPSVYINGSKVPSTINYRDVKLSPHQEIALVYGRPPSQPGSIPSAYDFPPGL